MGPLKLTGDWSAETRARVGDGDVRERRVHRRTRVNALGDADDVIVGQRHRREDAASVQLLEAERSVCDDRRWRPERRQDQGDHEQVLENEMRK